MEPYKQPAPSEKPRESRTAMMNDEAQIRALFEDFSRAFMAKDLDKIMSFYAPDVVAYDIAPPLQFAGKESYRKSWEKWMPQMDRVESHEMSDLKIAVGGDVAFSHCLSHMIATMKSGERMDSWIRYTAGFRKINGKWLIVHEQLSVPIDMNSQKALWDLKPEQGVVH